MDWDSLKECYNKSSTANKVYFFIIPFILVLAYIILIIRRIIYIWTN